MGRPLMRAASASVDEPLAQIRRATFRDQIAERLRHAIVDGQIAPGSAVTEQQLAAEFGVSRGPLREAMGQLVEEGLLVSVPYTATRVVSLSRDDVSEIYSLRTALETLAFAQIWDRRTPQFARTLKARHKELLLALPAGDGFASSLAEVKFHSTVYEFCGHRLLLETWRRISARLHLYLAIHQKAHGRAGPLDDAHSRYVELALGDRLDLMQSEIEHHMQRGIVQLQTYLQDGRFVAAAPTRRAAPGSGA
ncbi:GntR family transcriptional regulator [Phreatobacter sp.]|uniref:GntR family transcriptional regulator n=1 Tax=Phreatobacter sp. TaxID=1966341 RepID=UPI0025F00DBD|nr:GntR family transcriptional regulator [Phreatobacter sp.]